MIPVNKLVNCRELKIVQMSAIAAICRQCGLDFIITIQKHEDVQNCSVGVLHLCPNCSAENHGDFKITNGVVIPAITD